MILTGPQRLALQCNKLARTAGGTWVPPGLQEPEIAAKTVESLIRHGLVIVTKDIDGFPVRTEKAYGQERLQDQHQARHLR